jgi:hypothetical protein
MPEEKEIQEGTGAIRDEKDERDHRVRDLIAAGAVAPVTEAEWDAGFSATRSVGLEVEVRDQGGRSSCVAEACAAYGRVIRKKTKGDDVTFSASSLYPFIRQPGGGASLRDGVKETVAGRLVPKKILPDEDANGNPLPESVVGDKSRVTAAIAAEGTKLDVFDNYRMAEGGTDDIEIFAAAIKYGLGAILGFTGTNNGWCSCPVIRHPAAGEPKWGHAVYGDAFGKTDVAECGIPIGTKAIFIPGSWGGRYTFTSGRWKGYSAITAAYFEAGEQTAVGFVKGIYVFNGWTIIPSAIVPPDQFGKDFCKQHDNKLAFQNPGDGSFGIIAGGELRTIAADRAGQASLTCIMRGITTARTINVDKDTWAKLPQRPL